MKYVFSFGGGATSLLGGLKAIQEHGFENVDVINAALLDDEKYIKPVLDAFERVSGKRVKRISYHSERLHLTKRAVDDAYNERLTPQMLRWLLEGIGTKADGIGQVIEVDAPQYSIWHVNFMKRYLSNTMSDPCSNYLKRIPVGKYIADHHAPGEACIGVAMTSDEIDRMMSVTGRWNQAGYSVFYPLADDDRYGDKEFVRAEFERVAGFIPDAYQIDFSHNNCTPCVKGGKLHHAKALYHRRKDYLYSEAMEQLWRDTFRKEHTILRETANGERVYITLREFRVRMEAQWRTRMFAPFDGLEGDDSACKFCEAAA